jgi:hypothetical protein
MATSTRYIGLCPVCQNFIKVRDGLLVHHGYERPGFGYIVGDCFGVHRPPHELSVETAKTWLEVMLGRMQELERRLERLPELQQLPEKVFTGRKSEIVYRKKSEVSEYDWNLLYRAEKLNVEMSLREVKREVARVQALVDTWKPMPLKTVEEDVASKKAASAVRKEAQREVKAAKMAAKVEFYRKKYASLLAKIEKAKKKDPNSLQFLQYDLARFPEDVYRGLLGVIGWSSDRSLVDEAIASLDIPEVTSYYAQRQQRSMKSKLLR